MFGPVLLYIFPLFLLTDRSPQYGEIKVRNNNVKEFAQADIWNRAVRYLHTSGEIGIDRVYDSATFAVTDGSFPGNEKSCFLLEETLAYFFQIKFSCMGNITNSNNY